MDRFINETKTDMEVTFLGTASCIPSITRGVSSTLLRLDGDMFIFDCGEGTQLQIQKISSKLSTISKIFITHTHGDHFFGLPGLLCFLGQAIQMSQTPQVIDIYGPMGIRDYIRASMSMTYSRVAVPHRIHELADIPYLHGYRQEDCSYGGQPTVKTRYDPTYGEIDKGSTIYPNEDGTYTLFEDFKSTMKAAPLRHTIPCVGYVYTEKPKLGQLKVNEIKEIVARNKDSLKLKYNDVNTVLRDLKALGQEDSYTFPDGTIVKGCDIVEKPIRGRKVVILGDTCNSDMIAPIAMNADLLIHEATNAYFEDSKFSNYNYLERDTRNHGHSTPQMAGSFANKINAKRLVLTHFSNRYLGDESDYSMKVMWKIEDMARETCPSLNDPNSIVAAWDMLQLPVQSTKTKIKKRNNINSEAVLVDLKQYSDSKKLNRHNVYISQYNENDFEDVKDDEQNN